MLLQLMFWVEFTVKAALIHFKVSYLAAHQYAVQKFCKNPAIDIILQESNSLLEAARISLIRGLCNNLTFEAILQLSHLRLGVC